MIELILSRPQDGRRILEPATQHDMEALVEGMAPGKYATAKLTQARSLKQNRFYWSLLSQAVDNQSFYTTTRALHVWLKLKLGIVESVVMHDGRTHLQVGSTDFDRMDAREFCQYLDIAIDLIINDVVPGAKRDLLIKAVEQASKIKMADFRRGAAFE